jgi:hypothetical protein
MNFTHIMKKSYLGLLLYWFSVLVDHIMSRGMGTLKLTVQVFYCFIFIYLFIHLFIFENILYAFKRCGALLSIVLLE